MSVPWTRLLLLALIISVLLTISGHPSAAQSSRRGSGTRRGQAKLPFTVKFWNYLVHPRSGYRHWGAFPGRPEGTYEGQSPHGAFLKMYANKMARENPQTLPSGSIIVKENYGADQTTLMAVTVMYRSQGYNPDHNDWYWVKYKPNGVVARTPEDKGNKPIAGRFASCIECHSGADGNDYAFAND